ncbi:MAG: NUDIX domain-containing protein [Pseudomonadota bacterium]
MTKIPEDAKLVFEGLLFKIYQWEQKMFDGSYQTFELAKRDDNVQILVTMADKVVLVEEIQPNYSEPSIAIPGGNVHPDEEPIEAAKRELLEETGLKCEKLELYYVEELGSKLVRQFYIFIGCGAKKIQEPEHTNGEVFEVLGLTFNEFVEQTQKSNFNNPVIRKKVREMLYEADRLEEFRMKLFGEKDPG